MKYEVVLTDQAESDLRGIYEYIAFVLLAPGNAISQLRRLELNISNLEKLPNRFKLYDKEPWHSRGLMQMPVDNFVVFYIVDSAKSVVSVIRIMYGGRNMDEQLRIN